MDSPDFVSSFIASIRSRPVIWDTRAPRYRHNEQALRAWKDIRHELAARFPMDGFNVVDLKKKWKSLRASFNREKRLHYIRYGHNDEFGECQSRWKWYASMAFLEVLNDDSTHSSVEGNGFDCGGDFVNNDFSNNGDHLELTIHYSDEEDEETKPLNNGPQMDPSLNEDNNGVDAEAAMLSSTLCTPVIENGECSTTSLKRPNTPDSPQVVDMDSKEFVKRLKFDHRASSKVEVNLDDEDEIFGRLCAAKLRLVKKNKGACQVELLQILTKYVEQQ